MQGSSALARILGLLREPPGDPDVTAGYLDLLGPAPQRPPSLTMLTRALADRGFTGIRQRRYPLMQVVGGVRH